MGAEFGSVAALARAKNLKAALAKASAKSVAANGLSARKNKAAALPVKKAAIFDSAPSIRSDASNHSLPIINAEENGAVKNKKKRSAKAASGKDADEQSVARRLLCRPG